MARWLHGETIVQLAREHNMGETTIAHLVHGDTWKSLFRTEERSV
jgi:hypothetical protein